MASPFMNAGAFGAGSVAHAQFNPAFNAAGSVSNNRAGGWAGAPAMDNDVFANLGVERQYVDVVKTVSRDRYVDVAVPREIMRENVHVELRDVEFTKRFATCKFCS